MSCGAMVEVSIVIVCMNRLDNLYPCLESIARHTEVEHETLVVAYMFSPENLKKARRDFPDVTFIVSDCIRGFSENNNLALRHARGRWCFVLNDDTEMHSDVIGALLEDFSKLPSDCAIVSPKQLNTDGSLQLCGRPPYPARNYLLQQFHLYSEPADNVSGRESVFGQVYRTWNICGAAFLIRTDIFRELGFFDERYFFTPEDIALSTLAISRGYSVYVDAGVSIVHKWKATSSRMLPATRPAAIRGSLMFFSGGSRARYLLLAAGVWCAEFLKLVKAAVRNGLHPTDESRLRLSTCRNIVRSIFTRKTPKELFTLYYNQLRSQS